MEDIVDAFMIKTVMEQTLRAEVGLVKDYNKKLTPARRRGKGKYHRSNVKSLAAALWVSSEPIY